MAEVCVSVWISYLISGMTTLLIGSELISAISTKEDSAEFFI